MPGADLKKQRDALLAACQEALPYMAGMVEDLDDAEPDEEPIVRPIYERMVAAVKLAGGNPDAD